MFMQCIHIDRQIKGDDDKSKTPQPKTPRDSMTQRRVSRIMSKLHMTRRHVLPTFPTMPDRLVKSNNMSDRIVCHEHMLMCVT